MRRPLAVLIAIVVLSGCNQTKSFVTADPFFGSTRVPAPRTGMLPKRPTADPYYSSRRDAVHPLRPASPLEATTTGAIARRYQPPGRTFDYRENADKPATSAISSAGIRGSGDRVSIPMAARRETDWLAQGSSVATGNSSAKADRGGSSSAPAAGTLARRGTLEQALQTRPRTDMARSRRRPLLPMPKAVDYRMSQPGRSEKPTPLTDLPPTRTSGCAKPRFVDGNVRQALATEEVSSTTDGSLSAQASGGVSQSSSDRARYGYDPQYKWLRGKLEYSQRDGRWKLRYIPVYGETDEYGGSVVLKDVSRLSGYERGDFVEVHGQIGPAAEEEQGFAPGFKISRIVSGPVGR